MAARNLALAGALVGLLGAGARRPLALCMMVVGFVQLVDACLDAVEGRWAVLPGVLLLGVLYLAAAGGLAALRSGDWRLGGKGLGAGRRAVSLRERPTHRIKQKRDTWGTRCSTGTLVPFWVEAHVSKARHGAPGLVVRVSRSIVRRRRVGRGRWGAPGRGTGAGRACSRGRVRRAVAGGCRVRAGCLCA